MVIATGDPSAIMDVRTALSSPEVVAFCRRWRIRELALFGSAQRGEMGPTSDVDLLATFESAASWSLLDHVRMEEELGVIVGRTVDVVTRRGLEMSPNPLLRRAILESAERVYARG